MEKITMRTVRTDGGMITYQLERKQIKNKGADYGNLPRKTR